MRTALNILRTLVQIFWLNNHVFCFSCYVISHLASDFSKVAPLIHAPVSKWRERLLTDGDFSLMDIDGYWVPFADRDHFSLLLKFSPFTVQRWWSCPKNLGIYFIRETKTYVPGSRMFQSSITGGRGYSLLECCAGKFNTATKCLALKIISR